MIEKLGEISPFFIDFLGRPLWAVAAGICQGVGSGNFFAKFGT